MTTLYTKERKGNERQLHCLRFLRSNRQVDCAGKNQQLSDLYVPIKFIIHYLKVYLHLFYQYLLFHADLEVELEVNMFRKWEKARMKIEIVTYWAMK